MEDRGKKMTDISETTILLSTLMNSARPTYCKKHCKHVKKQVSESYQWMGEASSILTDPMLDGERSDLIKRLLDKMEGSEAKVSQN